MFELFGETTKSSRFHVWEKREEATFDTHKAFGTVPHLFRDNAVAVFTGEGNKGQRSNSIFYLFHPNTGRGHATDRDPESRD